MSDDGFMYMHRYFYTFSPPDIFLRVPRVSPLNGTSTTIAISLGWAGQFFVCVVFCQELLKIPHGHELPYDRLMTMWRTADSQQKGFLDFREFCFFYVRIWAEKRYICRFF